MDSAFFFSLLFFSLLLMPPHDDGRWWDDGGLLGLLTTSSLFFMYVYKFMDEEGLQMQHAVRMMMIDNNDIHIHTIQSRSMCVYVCIMSQGDIPLHTYIGTPPPNTHTHLPTYLPLQLVIQELRMMRDGYGPKSVYTWHTWTYIHIPGHHVYLSI